MKQPTIHTIVAAHERGARRTFGVGPTPPHVAIGETLASVRTRQQA